MPLIQFARGLWAKFGSENPFSIANGMEENLRLIDDHLALYTLQLPQVPGTPLPETPQDGDGQIYTDGSYSTFNGGTWKNYAPRFGVRAVLGSGTEHWLNTGDAWAQYSVLDTGPAVAAVTDAKVAAETAAINAAVSAGKVAFTSSATGFAATTNGQYFSVVQPYGEGVDGYLNIAGVASWKKSSASGDLAIAEIVERYYPFTITPVCAVFSHHTLVNNGRGANNAARPNAKIFGRNLYPYVHGSRNQGTGPTTSLFFADGPTKIGTATRILFSASNQSWSLWTSGYRPPAGIFTVDLWVKSNTGVDIPLRTGNSANGYTARTAPGATWVRIQHEITTDGTNWATWTITGDGTNVPDILIDQTRIYPDIAANVPSFDTEQLGDDFMPCIAWPRQRHSGRALDNTSAAAEGSGVLRVPGYPTPKTFSEVTFIALASMAAYQANQQLITTDHSTALGTTIGSLAITSAQADGALDFTGLTMLSDFDMVGQGLFVVGFRVKDGARQGYVDTVELASAASAFAGFQARLFRFGANASNETAYQNTFRWNGMLVAGMVYPNYLTDSQYAAEVETLKNRARAAGHVMGDMPIFIICMGDSQTSAFSGSRGPSWAVLQADAGRYTPNAPVRNLGVGGYMLNDLKAQLPTVKMLIQQINAVQGRRAIVPIYIGTNDSTEIIAGPAAYWARLKAELLDVIESYGDAKCVVGSLCPIGGLAGWETARLQLRTLQLADSRYGSVIMDFGNPATVMGNPATVTDLAYYEADQKHFFTGGQAALAPEAAAKIKVARTLP